MTKFQEYLNKNRSLILNGSFELFKSYYPLVPEKLARKQFSEEITGLFFRGRSRESYFRQV